MRRSALLLPALLLLLLASSAEAAGGAKKAERVLAVLVILPGILALFAYPVGLAFHALVLGYAPRRALGLVHRLERHRVKTVLLGVGNTVFLLLVVAVTAQRAPALAVLASVTWLMLALVGSHGLARALGARLLGREPGDHPGPPDDLKVLALGWFVLVCGAAFPFVGWLLLAYWSVRATGGVFLALFSVRDEAPSPRAEDDVDYAV